MKSKRKSTGYWMKEKNAVALAKKIKKKHGFESLPEQKKLNKLGYSDLATAIQRHYGGMRKFREILGEEQLKVEDGLWKDLDYTIEQAKKIKKKHGFESLPSIKNINDLGYSSLVGAICKYHGGFSKFRELLGEKQLRLKDGLWPNLDYCISQAMKFFEEYPGFENLPSADKLKKFDYSGLVNAINTYHGGLRNFRKILGKKVKEIPDWKDLDYCVEQAKKVMKKHGFKTLPKQKELFKLKYSSLGIAIYKYHGGFKKFRKLLGEKIVDWKDLDYTIEQAKKVMDKHEFDEFPGQKKLDKLSYSSLSSAINKYHGGMPVFRAKLNESLGIKNVSESERLESVIDGFLEEN